MSTPTKIAPAMTSIAESTTSAGVVVRAMCGRATRTRATAPAASTNTAITAPLDRRAASRNNKAPNRNGTAVSIATL